MSVTANVSPINIVNFGQMLPDVPTAKPIAYWFVQSGVTGDATAGFVVFNFLLTSGAVTFPFQGRSALGVYLSVEEMRGRVTHINATNTTKQILIAGDLVRCLVVTGTLTPGSPNTQFAAMSAESNSIPRTPYTNLFICSPGVTYSVAQSFDPNVNGSVYNAMAWGYIWDVKSILELGGPERPPGFNPS